MIQTLFGSVEQEPSLLEKLKSGVQKTRAGLVSRLEDCLQGAQGNRRRSAGRAGIHADLRRYRRAHHRRDSGPHPRARRPPPAGRRRRTAQASSASTCWKSCKPASAPGAGGRAARGDSGGGRQRLGQDHHHRQTGPPVPRRAAHRAALRGRYVPRGRHRAAGNLGRAHRAPSDPAEAGQRPQRGAVRCAASGARAQNGLRDRGYRRAPADQGQSDGRAAEDEPHRPKR